MGIEELVFRELFMYILELTLNDWRWSITKYVFCYHVHSGPLYKHPGPCHRQAFFIIYTLHGNYHPPVRIASWGHREIMMKSSCLDHKVCDGCVNCEMSYEGAIPASCWVATNLTYCPNPGFRLEQRVQMNGEGEGWGGRRAGRLRKPGYTQLRLHYSQ